MASRARSQLSEDAFARLFDNLHEGIYIGFADPESDATATLTANPHLRLIFGWSADTPESDVRPFDAEQFVGEQAAAPGVGILAARAADHVPHVLVAGARDAARIPGEDFFEELAEASGPAGGPVFAAECDERIQQLCLPFGGGHTVGAGHVWAPIVRCQPATA